MRRRYSFLHTYRKDSMHAYYALLAALTADQPVILTIDDGTFITAAEDALAVLNALAPGDVFHVGVTNA